MKRCSIRIQIDSLPSDIDQLERRPRSLKLKSRR